MAINLVYSLDNTILLNPLYLKVNICGAEPLTHQKPKKIPIIFLRLWLQPPV